MWRRAWSTCLVDGGGISNRGVANQKERISFAFLYFVCCILCLVSFILYAVICFMTSVFCFPIPSLLSSVYSFLPSTVSTNSVKHSVAVPGSLNPLRASLENQPEVPDLQPFVYIFEEFNPLLRILIERFLLEEPLEIPCVADPWFQLLNRGMWYIFAQRTLRCDSRARSANFHDQRIDHLGIFCDWLAYLDEIR